MSKELREQGVRFGFFIVIYPSCYSCGKYFTQLIHKKKKVQKYKHYCPQCSLGRGAMLPLSKELPWWQKTEGSGIHKRYTYAIDKTKPGPFIPPTMEEKKRKKRVVKVCNPM
jgi:hypothetical protein